MSEPFNGAPTVVERTDEYVEVSHRVPLWVNVPEEYRVTEKLIRERITSEHYADLFVNQLTNPTCVIAVRAQAHLNVNLWHPCRMSVRNGYDLCRIHGGPAVKEANTPAGIKKLTAENEELRRRIAALEAGRS